MIGLCHTLLLVCVRMRVNFTIDTEPIHSFDLILLTLGLNTLLLLQGKVVFALAAVQIFDLLILTAILAESFKIKELIRACLRDTPSAKASWMSISRAVFTLPINGYLLKLRASGAHTGFARVIGSVKVRTFFTVAIAQPLARRVAGVELEGSCLIYQSLRYLEVIIGPV